MQNVALTFWNATVAGMQNATKCRMHGVQDGASPRQPANMQTVYRASTAVKEPIKLGNPGGKHQRPGTGSRRATGAAGEPWAPTSQAAAAISAPCGRGLSRVVAGLWEFFSCCSVFLGVAESTE